MTKLHDVVRGVEERETLDHMRQSQKAIGYNDLASAEVVVSKEKIAKMIKAMAYVDDDVAFDPTNEYINDIASVIATAIACGSIISLKEDK